ncbi:MAG: hypothetical protein CML02_06770 [Pseudooceanicola sp.]|jgi:chromosome segregation ATPase|nr:hypothetical protein [Pseudooceanicola sp.]|tara:strand:+ start:361 stop:750 length:390 start_codon:yes stop_codon:yes gene_type:complete
MADDVKSLGKRLTAVEKQLGDITKRLKFNEDRIKVLADSLTSEKDIEKLLDTHISKMDRERADDMKSTMRRMDLQEKLVEAQKRESQKEIEKYRQDAEAQAKAAIKDFEKSKLEARLIRLEALMKTLGR